MDRQAIWVHGNAVVIGLPGTDIVGMHRDVGATFRGKANNVNFFQVSIPTPCWRFPVRAQLVMVALLFTSDGPVSITGIELYDGPNLIPASFPSLNVSGPHSKQLDAANRFELPTPLNILFGLGISIKVNFFKDGEITFNTLGADFYV
jgi:hypothetical protein